jgi:hypothetical protein
MTGTKHTPGPWIIFDMDQEVGVTPENGKGDIAHCSGFDSNRFHSEEVANAHLIAAAPDLLEALVLLLQVNDGVPMLGIEASKRIESARAAIAKAKGGPS